MERNGEGANSEDNGTPVLRVSPSLNEAQQRSRLELNAAAVQ